MGVYSDLDPAALRAALRQWGRGEPTAVTPTPLGIENSNFFVTLQTPGGTASEWVLTVMDHAPAECGLRVLNILDSAGLPVPAPVASTTGETVLAVDGHPALLAPRLHGEHPQQTTPAQCAAAGRFLGRMHRLTAGLAGPAHPRDLAWLERGWSRHHRCLGAPKRALMRRAINGINHASLRSDHQALPQGLVHGDLFRDNAMLLGDRLGGVIDFHHAARAPLLFDLAVVANDWCFGADLRPDPQRMLALLQAYDGERRLTIVEFWFWPVMLTLAALRFWVARLNSPRKPPEEMAAHLEAVLADPPLLTPDRLRFGAGSAAPLVDAPRTNPWAGRRFS
ncbi:MAG TPA: homoserine kinase [Pseudomonadales bacterium]|nr:homoserine kinase [Pseudomonadales bacterium]